ncbi:MAG: RecQ family ATP-dependent DNA helicase [Halothece sp.]
MSVTTSISATPYSIPFLFLDLEVNATGQIYRLGWQTDNDSGDYFEQDFATVGEKLNLLKQNRLICGHNFRRFDYPYLIQRFQELQPWRVVDTLELSILAFPLQPSHKLNKQYKQTEYTCNHPLEDARLTQKLFETILVTLEPHPLFDTYRWLLTCGTEEADKAYQHLFSIPEPPSLTSLPQEAIAGFNSTYLAQFWEHIDSYNFNQRLCVAGLLAWNYSRNAQFSKAAYSAWLSHLPGFAAILNSLRPLQPLSYTTYLSRFNLSQFRSLQETAIQTLLNGQSCFLLMPTGGGKSLCYQLPALMLYEQQKLLTVVISPLQALMADQVADLEENGLDFATFINGNLDITERRFRLQQLQDGEKGLLYISPEQLRSSSIASLLKERPPAFWVIDEAHCISQWGHDFRPDYRYIPKFLQELYSEKQLPFPRLALLTATATVTVREDIKSLFSQYNIPIESEMSAERLRPNLKYRVVPCQGNKDSKILQQVQHSLQEDGCVLAYTTTRKNAEKLANLLNKSGISARYYHGKLERTQKEEVLEAFKSGELNVVTATCAFGMGINRKDVRAVIHHTLSSSLENYIQEAGRAGRDGELAHCTLLFDAQDVDTIFFLKSLNCLSESDLKNIFIMLRGMRNRLYGEASEDWFWVTPSEIFATSDLEEEFASEIEQRETKIKVAIHCLETFGLVERAENLSTFIQFHLVHSNSKTALQKWQESSEYIQIKDSQKQQIEHLIVAMYLLQSYYAQENDSIPLDRLSDESGVSISHLPSRIHLLQKAGICTYSLPLTVLVTKGVTGDSRRSYQRLRKIEEQLLEIILELNGHSSWIQLNLRGVVLQLDPNKTEKLRAATLTTILENWSRHRWIRLTRLNRDVVRLEIVEDRLCDYLERYHRCCEAIIEVFYQQLGEQRGARLSLRCEFGELIETLSQTTPTQRWYFRDVESVLQGLHRQKLIRLTEGMSLFHQALKLRVIRRASVATISRRYSEVQQFYQQQNRRTQIMLYYGQLEEQAQRNQLVEDYFQLTPEQFAQKYPQFYQETATLPVLEEDYHRILDPLNEQQREIVLAEDAAIAVIAGPGSGKTRTLIHRIAYLIKVKRVRPDRILVLAYNRNAVRELRLRLQSLIGIAASSVRVFTFHGLALAVLGRTLGRQPDFEFATLLQEVCQLIEQGDELDDEETHTRRVQLLGNVEYIFVDEYQDVAADEYRLIQLLAGLGETEETSRSVQINLCVIGDDDQNIYQFKGTSPQYILQFEREYQAKRFLLIENYRSTEPIIDAACQLIQHNQQRCKQQLQEQVRINFARRKQGGTPVAAYSFANPSAQALWIQQKVQKWLNEGAVAQDIAILARKWDDLAPVRLLLEAVGIQTYALKSNEIKLVRNYATQRLIEHLQSHSHWILATNESFEEWLRSLFNQYQHGCNEPTVQTLLKIAQDLDLERGYGNEEMALPMSGSEILTALFEFSYSGESMIAENAVLVTTCHGAKGLEFRKVILLTNDFRGTEAERRLFYVGMTRAKEELILCSVTPSQFVKEAGVKNQSQQVSSVSLPRLLKYLDFAPRDIHLGHPATIQNQSRIRQLREGMRLELRPNRNGNSWVIWTSEPPFVPIGGFASGRSSSEKVGMAKLLHQGLRIGEFQFQVEEVRVKHIYHHVKRNELTAQIEEDWFVVIPSIQICRY